MREVVTTVVLAAVTATVLVGCTGPNQEAVAAAEAYSGELTEWTTALAAVEPAEGEGLGDVLDDAPELPELDGVDHTPSYLAARDAAERVDAIVGELAAMEPETLHELEAAAADAYWVTADLYYFTLGAAGDRLNAISGSWDEEDPRAAHRTVVDAHILFAETRLELLGTAIEEFPEVVPDTDLGRSIGAFAADWYHEEAVYQERSIEEMRGWREFSNGFKDFWNHGNLHSLLAALPGQAPGLRAGFVRQAGEVAAALEAIVGSGRDDGEAPALPGVAEPYRQALVDGYRPWDDPDADQGHAVMRLWMLWRIRELEDTPEESYRAARAVLLQELNRGIGEGTAGDFRPGSWRLLNLVKVYSEAYGAIDSVDEAGLAALSEIHRYGAVLREWPMTEEVAAAYDELLGIYEELNAEAAAIAERADDPRDALLEVRLLGREYQDIVLAAATPALERLDDDERFEELLAATIAATRPAG